jgi:hypothetical protein
LTAAILARAVRDALAGDALARVWLISSPWAGDLLDGLGLDRDAARAWVRELAEVA